MNEGTDDGNKNSNNLHNSSIVDANSIKTNKNANEKGGNNKTKLINDGHSNHKISLNNNTKNCDVTNNNKNTNRNSHIEKVTQKRASK
jgi:hypothetical protein